MVPVGGNDGNVPMNISQQNMVMFLYPKQDLLHFVFGVYDLPLWLQGGLFCKLAMHLLTPSAQ